MGIVPYNIPDAISGILRRKRRLIPPFTNPARGATAAARRQACLTTVTRRFAGCRGGCLHPPGFSNIFGESRDDVGIVPYNIPDAISGILRRKRRLIPPFTNPARGATAAARRQACLTTVTRRFAGAVSLNPGRRSGEFPACQSLPAPAPQSRFPLLSAGEPGGTGFSGGLPRSSTGPG